MEAMTDRNPSLADPDYAAFAWRRYRRLMTWVSLAAALAAVLALLYLHEALGELRIATIIATVAGVGLTITLGGALMGLVFLSSGTGHDESITNFEEDR
jgi:peptidoglycan/LPS O-acetylase OafA/YrhL